MAIKSYKDNKSHITISFQILNRCFYRLQPYQYFFFHATFLVFQDIKKDYALQYQ